METIKGSQKEILELKSTIREKLTEGFNSRSEQVKERINEFQGKTLRNYLIQGHKDYILYTLVFLCVIFQSICRKTRAPQGMQSNQIQDD